LGNCWENPVGVFELLGAEVDRDVYTLFLRFLHILKLITSIMMNILLLVGCVVASTVIELND
jgi:hypothetical protein